jgi:hypothetical protein
MSANLGHVIASRENIREHDIVRFFFLGIGGQSEAIEIGIWHAEVVGLAALIRTHTGVTIGSARVSGIGGQAESGEAAFTVSAKAATYG